MPANTKATKQTKTATKGRGKTAKNQFNDILKCAVIDGDILKTDEEQTEIKKLILTPVHDITPDQEPEDKEDEQEPEIIKPTIARLVDDQEDEDQEDEDEDEKDEAPPEEAPPEETDEERELRELEEEDAREKAEQLKKAQERAERMMRLKFKKDIQPLRTEAEIKKLSLISKSNDEIKKLESQIQELTEKINLIKSIVETTEEEINEINAGKFDADLIDEKIKNDTKPAPKPQMAKVSKPKTTTTKAKAEPADTTEPKEKRERKAGTRRPLYEVIRQKTDFKIIFMKKLYTATSTDGYSIDGTDEATKTATGEYPKYATLNEWVTNLVNLFGYRDENGNPTKRKLSVYKEVDYYNIREEKWVTLELDYTLDTVDFNPL